LTVVSATSGGDERRKGSIGSSDTEEDLAAASGVVLDKSSTWKVSSKWILVSVELRSQI